MLMEAVCIVLHSSLCTTALLMSLFILRVYTHLLWQYESICFCCQVPFVYDFYYSIIILCFPAQSLQIFPWGIFVAICQRSKESLQGSTIAVTRIMSIYFHLSFLRMGVSVKFQLSVKFEFLSQYILIPEDWKIACLICTHTVDYIMPGHEGSYFRSPVTYK